MKNKTSKSILKSFAILSLIIVLSSCYTTKTTNYVTKSTYAVFMMKSKDVESNFTHVKEGLKLTYDFWGDNLIIVLENISDKTIFVDIDNSQVKSEKEKEIYNNMIAGDFNVLPIEPGNKIELNDFYIINTDNETLVKEKIKIAKQFTNKLLSFKTGDYPININNKVVFGFSKDKASEFIIDDNFYSDSIKLLTPEEYNHLNQYGKLYNKTYYQISTTNIEETSKLEPIIPPADMAEIMINTLITVVFIALNFY